MYKRQDADSLPTPTEQVKEPVDSPMTLQPATNGKLTILVVEDNKGYMIESYPVKKSSAYLFVPYLLWLILATYLNGYILMYN